ncbi:hypothetical protein BDV96DRAFT_147182 [Lophiotrema nucula]|uniref:C2H2-type domain-containing protein n=1 Tax=Lophiotrema nucula TaxID=690887 RepID=A0A6A5Z3E6_9PLEO|nr:hypothetical protein BDV96DRAFT_147182 [Lophiotrema nucula]
MLISSFNGVLLSMDMILASALPLAARCNASPILRISTVSRGRLPRSLTSAEPSRRTPLVVRRLRRPARHHVGRVVSSTTSGFCVATGFDSGARIPLQAAAPCTPTQASIESQTLPRAPRSGTARVDVQGRCALELRPCLWLLELFLFDCPCAFLRSRCAVWLLVQISRHITSHHSQYIQHYQCVA